MSVLSRSIMLALQGDTRTGSKENLPRGDTESSNISEPRGKEGPISLSLQSLVGISVTPGQEVRGISPLGTQTATKT